MRVFGIVGLKACSSYEHKQLCSVAEVQYNFFNEKPACKWCKFHCLLMASGAGCIACLWRVVRGALLVEQFLRYDSQIVYVECLVIINV